MIIPLGMVGGAVVGLLVARVMTGTGEPEIRRPGDPGDAHAMLGVFIMFAGAAAGTIVGVIVAVALYIKRKLRMKFK